MYVCTYVCSKYHRRWLEASSKKLLSWRTIAYEQLFIENEKSKDSVSKELIYVIIILTLLLCINSGVYLEYSSKHSKLHQDFDYIIYIG